MNYYVTKIVPVLIILVSIPASDISCTEQSTRVTPLPPLPLTPPLPPWSQEIILDLRDSIKKEKSLRRNLKIIKRTIRNTRIDKEQRLLRIRLDRENQRYYNSMRPASSNEQADLEKNIKHAYLKCRIDINEWARERLKSLFQERDAIQESLRHSELERRKRNRERRDAVYAVKAARKSRYNT